LAKSGREEKESTVNQVNNIQKPKEYRKFFQPVFMSHSNQKNRIYLTKEVI
jgi:hypothetical protein